MIKSYVAKTMSGLEQILADEITDLGGQQVKVLYRAVSFEADQEALYAINLSSRTALRLSLIHI